MSAFIVSKRHIDILVQSAIAGATDSRGWTHPGEQFSWYHNEARHEIDPYGDAARVWGYKELVPPSVLGQRLVDECVASVSGRYPNDDVQAGELPGPCDPYYLKPYVFEPVTDSNVMVIGAAGLKVHIGALVSTAELASGLFCYCYQSCEHEGWETSEAHAFVQAMKDNLLRSLPGHDAAPWGWD